MLLLKFCFTSTETVGLLGTGVQDIHLDFQTAPELENSRRIKPVYMLERQSGDSQHNTSVVDEMRQTLNQPLLKQTSHNLTKPRQLYSSNVRAR